MPLSVFSIKNFLKTCLQPYLIRSSCSDTVEADELVDIMASGRTTQSKPDIAGCMQLLVEEVVNLVSDGKHVKTPLGAFYLGASGKLDAVFQPFTPGFGTQDHALTLHFRTNKAVEALMQSRARWERIETFDTTAASVESATATGRIAEGIARAGETVRIIGRRMKFAGDDTACGVFLESGAGSWRAAVYPDINPSKLIVILPADIPAGTYDLSVATMPNGKNLKQGWYDKPFVIES